MLVTKMMDGVTYYAASVFQTGHIASWTRDRERAQRISRKLGDVVAQHYRGKPGGKSLAFVFLGGEETIPTTCGDTRSAVVF